LITIKIQDWVLNIDVNVMRDYYSSQPTIRCTCAYCRNFVKAYEIFPQAVKDFFSSLGIDPTKDVGEVYECNENEDGTHFYGGGFHIVRKYMII
jgi:hypothetical protein